MLIKNCSYIVTQDAKRRILKDYDIQLQGDRIINIAKHIKGRADLDGMGKVWMPGLVNAHTHIGMHALKGVCDDKELHEWLQEVVPRERKQSSRQVRLGAALACKEMIQSGTTTFCDMWWDVDPLIEAVQDSHMRSVIMMGVNEEVPEGQGLSAVKAFKKAEELLRQNKHDALINYGVEAHSIYRNSGEHLQQVAELAQEYNALLGIHVGETRKERFDCQQRFGCLPIQHLEKFRFLTQRTLLIHAVWCTKGEIGIIKKHGSNVVHNPVSNMKLASGGVLPLPEMHQAGISVGLGTDSVASNNNLDMFEEMKLTGLLHKHHRWDPTVVSLQTVLDMATIDGAKCLGMGHEIGSLEIGKKADIISLDLTASNMQPINNILSNIVYASRGGNVKDSIINGKLLMKNRKLP